MLSSLGLIFINILVLLSLSMFCRVIYTRVYAMLLIFPIS